MYHSDDAFAMMLLTLPLSPMGDSTVRPLSFDELFASFFDYIFFFLCYSRKLNLPYSVNPGKFPQKIRIFSHSFKTGLQVAEYNLLCFVQLPA